ncbi:MAG: sugar porter family MFS transporter [Anaerobiospirillum succiniciproducens]|uniref:sugar porter family MFS transporter n=1 Tax=Anaerobiospirillum succiniciproducens TaxID=13335 RepID=UPI002A75301F|nr:sugar porter family MFS transporter [Anaerobiospirillum succiniciproducens]MDY2798572.1 sugar porter family MFS transporter [Anaerobiospirillum succiniciproducens]
MNPQLNMKLIWTVSLVAACGGLLFGYDWVVIGGAKPFYEAYFGINDPFLSGWAMSSALLGCVLGAIISGYMSDGLGRKRTLIISAVLFTVSAWGTAWFDTFDPFVFFRIVGGIGIGIASGISPVYIAEISPADRRGQMVAINQLTIVIGILAAQLINLMIAEPITTQLTQEELAATWNGQRGWRWMFWAELVPAFAFFVLMFFVPESPRYLAKIGKVDSARKILNRIGGDEYAQATITEIETTLRGVENHKASLKETLKPKYRKALIIGIVLAAFQQWCGINVIFNYATDIFISAGMDLDSTLKSIVATGSINLIITIISLPLIDKIGRRRLMLIGSSGLAIIYVAMCVAYAHGVIGMPVLMLVLAAIAIYALTLAPVTWVLLSEIFPNRIRGMAVSIATLSLWIACFLLTYTYPIIHSMIGAAGSFGLYCIISVAGFVFIFKNVPETKNVSLEEIEMKLVAQN